MQRLVMHTNFYSSSNRTDQKHDLQLTIILTAFLIFLIPLSCRNSSPDIQSSKEAVKNTYSCKDLSTQFQTYEEALLRIKQSNFQIKDAVITSKSSWIRGASYYSCDGQTGYFVILTDQNNFLFQNMPITIWEGFKDTNSFGEYYNAYIRDRYLMYVGR